MSRVQALLSWIALISAGALSVFSFAPYRLYWIMPFSMAILVVMVIQRPQFTFRYGWIWGLSSYTAGFYWIYYSLHDIAGLTAWLAVPLVLLLPAYLALYPALVVWLSRRLLGNCQHPRYEIRIELVRWLIVFPALWTLAEWTRGWLLTGFSWGEVGYSQITESPLAGYAPLLGIHGVSWMVAWFAAVLALGLLYSKLHLRHAILGGVASLAIFFMALGVWSKQHEWTTPIGHPIRVALAQGNIPQSLRWKPEAFTDTLNIYYQQVAHTSADLMILPETALPAFLDEIPEGYLDLLRRSAQSNKMAVAVGVPLRESDHYVNAVVALTDYRRPYYAKQHLVPFGEYVPLPALTGWLYQYMNMPMSGFSRGEGHQLPLSMAGQKVAFNVCYEDGFGNEIIVPAREATLLANVSNLAWFGRSNAMSQHLQLSQARALETGRYMVRATNTGMTGIIRPNGVVASIAAPDSQQVLTGEVVGRTGWTPYMYYGNWLIISVSAVMVLAGCVIAGFCQLARTGNSGADNG